MKNRREYARQKNKTLKYSISDFIKIYVRVRVSKNSTEYKYTYICITSIVYITTRLFRGSIHLAFRHGAIRQQKFALVCTRTNGVPHRRPSFSLSLYLILYPFFPHHLFLFLSFSTRRRCPIPSSDQSFSLLPLPSFLRGRAVASKQASKQATSSITKAIFHPRSKTLRQQEQERAVAVVAAGARRTEKPWPFV